MTVTSSFAGLDLVPSSIVNQTDAQFGLRRRGRGRDVVIAAGAQTPWLDDFEGERLVSDGRSLVIGPASPKNAAALRKRLPWLAPAAIGLRTSAGFGDRLGLATPGHIRALREVGVSVSSTDTSSSNRPGPLTPSRCRYIPTT